MSNKLLLVVALGLALLVLAVRFILRTVDDDALLRSAQEGDVTGIRSALERGSDADYAFEGGMTPLMMAVSNEHYEAAQVLLDAGANPSVENYEGLSALKMARGGKMWNLLSKYTGRIKN